MPKFATLAVCLETSYRQTSAFVFYRDNEKESIPSCAREQRTLAMGDVAGDRSE